MATYFDTDLVGYSSTEDTQLRRLYGIAAVRNALKMAILADRGDIIGEPKKGGQVKALLMKPMRGVYLEDFRIAFMHLLTQEFEPKIEVKSLDIRPDYQNRRWHFQLTYMVPSLQDMDTYTDSLRGQ